MKIVIALPDTDGRGIIVRLETERLREEVIGLVNRGQRSRAMVHAISRGTIEETVALDELSSRDADCILWPERVSWVRSR